MISLSILFRSLAIPPEVCISRRYQIGTLHFRSRNIAAKPAPTCIDAENFDARRLGITAVSSLS